MLVIMSNLTLKHCCFLHQEIQTHTLLHLNSKMKLLPPFPTVKHAGGGMQPLMAPWSGGECSSHGSCGSLSSVCDGKLLFHKNIPHVTEHHSSFLLVRITYFLFLFLEITGIFGFYLHKK